MDEGWEVCRIRQVCIGRRWRVIIYDWHMGLDGFNKH
jgi:hypothetical protein